MGFFVSMSNYDAFHNLYISFCGDKIVNFLGKRPLVLSSQCSNFVNKIHEIVRIKEEKMGHEKLMCFFFDPN
jgi:hypothetical protein